MTQQQHHSVHHHKGIKGFEGLLLFVGIGLCWQVTTTMLPLHDSTLYPSPAVTFKALQDSFPELLKGTLSSFLILIPGYF